MNNMVSWRDYEGVDGFGASSIAEVQELNKALAAGSSQNPPGSATAGDGFALRVESLERTLKNITFRMEHIVFWKDIPKTAAFNTVEEYNQLLSYGTSPGAGFVTEGALPTESDSTYQRKFVTIKYMGVSRRVTHPMTLVRPAHGNVIAQETINGTMELLSRVENALFFARSDLDAVQFDGIERQIEDGVSGSSGNVIDLRGRPLSEEVLNDAALTVLDAPNYGIPTDLYCNPKVKADLVKAFFPKARYDLGSLQNKMIGGEISGFTSAAGPVRFKPDVFISDGGGVSGLVASGPVAGRPGSPTISTPPAAAGTAAPLWTVADAGNYFYWVVAVNSAGSSAPVQCNAAALAVAATNTVTIGVTPGVGPLPTYYILYRTAPGGAASSARQILRIANSGGAAETVLSDVNARLPGCTSAFLLQMNMENIQFKQLAPMMRIPLSTVDATIRWMQLLYGAPVLETPRKNVVFRNVGRTPDYVGAP